MSAEAEPAYQSRELTPDAQAEEVQGGEEAQTIERVRQCAGQHLWQIIRRSSEQITYAEAV